MDGFRACFAELEDPRFGNARRHDLQELFLIAYCIFIKQRQIDNCTKCDAAYGAGVADALGMA